MMNCYIWVCHFGSSDLKLAIFDIFPLFSPLAKLFLLKFSGTRSDSNALNPIAFRKARTPLSFGHSECDRVKK